MEGEKQLQLQVTVYKDYPVQDWRDKAGGARYRGDRQCLRLVVYKPKPGDPAHFRV
jgi:hypothetical protein